MLKEMLKIWNVNPAISHGEGACEIGTVIILIFKIEDYLAG